MMKFLVLIFVFVSSVASTPSKEGAGLRIIGGTLAVPGELPFSAAIYHTTSDGTYFCAGGLISNDWVLTAGQCVDGALRFTITFGTTTLDGNEPTRVSVAAEEYVIHPDYNARTLENDIGLIKLRIPITFTDYIKPMELPSMDLPTYSVVIAFGWGQTDDTTSGLVTDLNRVTLTVLSNAECQLVYGNQITDNMVCVDGNYNQGTCNGDSGGPLVQYTHGQYATHVAVSSFVSGNGCESTDPSGYTRTFPYVQWIRNVTNIS